MTDADVGSDGREAASEVWRLGSKPNLRQMHHDARNRVSPDLVEAKLLDEIGKLKSLTAGASAAGPESTTCRRSRATSRTTASSTTPSSGPRRPRSPASRAPRRAVPRGDDWRRPAARLSERRRPGRALPRRAGLAREGHPRVPGLGRGPKPARATETSIRSAKRPCWPTSTRPASAFPTRSTGLLRRGDRLGQNEVQAFKITVATTRCSRQIKADTRSRIQETAVSADALLPGGPYDLWREGETSRRVKDLVGAFAQFPHLPKMLNRKAILDTLVGGCVRGTFVLRLSVRTRPSRTWWSRPDENAFNDSSLELVLPQAAMLDLSRPDSLPRTACPGFGTGANCRSTASRAISAAAGS